MSDISTTYIQQYCKEEIDDKCTSVTWNSKVLSSKIKTEWINVGLHWGWMASINRRETEVTAAKEQSAPPR